MHIIADTYEVFNTDKKENRIFVIYKEIQMGSVAKSYMRIEEGLPVIQGASGIDARFLNQK